MLHFRKHGNTSRSIHHLSINNKITLNPGHKLTRRPSATIYPALANASDTTDATGAFFPPTSSWNNIYHWIHACAISMPSNPVSEMIIGLLYAPLLDTTKFQVRCVVKPIHHRCAYNRLRRFRNNKRCKLLLKSTSSSIGLWYHTYP